MNSLCIGLELMVFGARLCLGEPVDPQTRTIVVCPTIEEWSTAEQQRLRAEILTLGPGSAAATTAGQLIRLRDQARRCRDDGN